MAVSDLQLPAVDLPEIILEIAARTRFATACTHISERASRASDLELSLCAVLLGEACNIGLEPLTRTDAPAALRAERLSWVNQNFVRDDTLSAANALLVAAQNTIPLAQAWGGGEVASADGIGFIVPVKTVSEFSFKLSPFFLKDVITERLALASNPESAVRAAACRFRMIPRSICSAAARIS
jgi:hypothetical protein